jgi:hypothetical protein
MTVGRLPLYCGAGAAVDRSVFFVAGDRNPLARGREVHLARAVTWEIPECPAQRLAAGGVDDLGQRTKKRRLDRGTGRGAGCGLSAEVPQMRLLVDGRFRRT